MQTRDIERAIIDPIRDAAAPARAAHAQGRAS